MIRSCAANDGKDTVHRTIPATAARLKRNMYVFLTLVIPLFDDSLFVGSNPLAAARSLLLSHYEVLQCLPRWVILRLELLTSAVMGIATGLLRERMMDKRTVQAAQYCHALYQLEVLPR